MQRVFLMLSGSSLGYSFLLLLGATLPFLFLLANLLISIQEKKYHEAFKPSFLLKSLSGLALLGYLILALFSFHISQPAVSLTLHLGGILGLIMAALCCVLLPFFGTALLLSLVTFPFVVIELLFWTPFRLLKGWGELLLTGRRSSSVNWQALRWIFVPAFLPPIVLLLIYIGYAFLVAQQTQVSPIAFWSTLTSVPISTLLILDFFFLTRIIRRLASIRPSPPLQFIANILSGWITPVYIPSKQLFSSTRWIDLAEEVTDVCVLAMGTLLPLIFLALPGGLIGAFLI